jgi:hypothetical protein
VKITLSSVLNNGIPKVSAMPNPKKKFSGVI